MPKRVERGAGTVAEVLEALRKAEWPPEVLRQLGLPRDWNQKIPEAFVEKLVEYLTKHKDLFDELGQR